MDLLAAVRQSDMWFTARIYRWRPRVWVRRATVATTRLGDGWLWAAVAALLLANGARFQRVLMAATFAGLISTATFAFLKRRFRRPRPCELAEHPVFRLRAPDRFSFPSGHTINAFGICTVLGLAWPRLAPVLAALAAGIAASRVALGLHYVSDVIAGALLGTIIGTMVGLALLH